MSKNLEIKKLGKTIIPADQQKEHGDTVAFELVEFTINFFGAVDTFTLDTRISKDGTQSVVDGNGWIKHGYILQE